MLNVIKTKQEFNAMTFIVELIECIFSSISRNGVIQFASKCCLDIRPKRTTWWPRYIVRTLSSKVRKEGEEKQRERDRQHSQHNPYVCLHYTVVFVLRFTSKR